MSNVVVGIISRKNSRGGEEFLLVSAKKDFGEYTGAYYPPGGHVEEGEDEKIALAREIREELGVAANIYEKIAESLGDVTGQTTHWYKARIETDIFKVDEREIADYGWFTLEEMKTIKLWPATKQFFNL